MAREALWSQPLGSGLSRLRAWMSMLFVDHGILRLAYLNCHQVSPGFWRAAQPAPNQIAALKRKHGLKTIVNLRGGRDYGSWPLEREACEAQGIALREFVVRSREAPDRETMLAAADFFASLDMPALVHCKSGADRAGFVSALYLLVHEKRPVREAMRQLSLRFGHFHWAKTGILDAFFEAYAREGEEKGLSFETWLREVYDPQSLRQEFKPGFWASLLVDRIMRRE